MVKGKNNLIGSKKKPTKKVEGNYYLKSSKKSLKQSERKK